MAKLKIDWLPISIFFASLILFTYGLSTQEIISFDSRFYLFAQEMWRHGASWFPTTYQQPYADYTAASTLLIYSFTKLFGTLNKCIAILPSALAASLTLVITYLIGALQSKRWGLFAAFFLIMTIGYLKSARAITLDFYPTLFTATCFYLLCSADYYQQPKRTYWIYPLILLGFIFRGPIGLVVPTGVVCAYLVFTKQWQKLFMTAAIAGGILLLSSVLLVLLAYHVGGVAFMQDVLHMQVFGRMESSYLPLYFYFTDGLLAYTFSFPFACLVVLGVLRYGIVKRMQTLPQINFLLTIISWALIILIGMSIPGDKKIRYILPATPAFALIASYPFSAIIPGYFAVLRQISLRIFFVFTWAFIITHRCNILYFAKQSHRFWHPLSQRLRHLIVAANSKCMLRVLFC